jgi:hydroxymethylpyrimidine/phosphomethylpyrimidine kinase
MKNTSQQPPAVQNMGRVLIVAGVDPSGGAGMHADVKTVTMLGQYAAGAITALTVQNTIGVSDAMGVDPAFVSGQISAVLEDVGADTIKIGMLYSSAITEAVADAIIRAGFTGAVVVDPVMVATSGDRLLDGHAVDGIRQRLFPLAALVTPNLPEAEILSGIKIQSTKDMIEAGQAIRAQGAKAVLVKGGHMDADTLSDFLITADGVHELTISKLNTRHTHGTGCTYASAFAALIASGLTIEQAFPKAHAFVQSAIKAAPGFGEGHGPLGHACVKGLN